MYRSRLTLALVCAITIGLMSAASGAAAAEIGSRCIGTAGYNITTGVNVSGQSVVIPDNGVITRWGVGSPASSGVPMKLITVRPAGADWKVTAATATETVVTGVNEFAANLAVAAGDRIGMGGSMVLCAGDVGDNVKSNMSITPPSVGDTYFLSGSYPSMTSAMWARIEADADLDGFGDETQDACPQSAKLRTPCPTPKLATKVVSTEKSFSAIATTDIVTTVFASGSAKLPARGGKKAKTITFVGQPVASGPGTLSTVKLAWPKALKRALSPMSKRKKLKVTVSVTANGVLVSDVKHFTVKLHGTK